MPYENEHACRLREPEEFSRFWRKNGDREHEGKRYDVIYGKLKKDNATVEQAYRYPVSTWTESSAREHCREHGGRFEPATGGAAATLPAYPTARDWLIAPASMGLIHLAPEKYQAIMSAANGREGRSSVSSASETDAGTMVVRIRGVIEDCPSVVGTVLGWDSYQSLAAALYAAGNSRRVESVVMDIDSPGGAATGLDMVEDAIRAVRSAGKPIWSYITGAAESAAYWIAASTDRVVMSRYGIAGNIGVYAVLYDMSEAMKQQGIRPLLFTSGEFKGLGVPGQSLSEAQAAEVQRRVDFYANAFFNAVRQGRAGKIKDEAMVFSGRSFLGTEAVEVGLVDEIGTLPDTVMRLMKPRMDVRAAQARLMLERERGMADAHAEGSGNDAARPDGRRR